MATQYTPNLKLSLPTTGELSGAWGNEINNGITSMVEDAIAGQVTINTWSNNFHNLTTANGAEAEARNAILKFTDTLGQITGTLATVQCPSVSKIYCVENATSKPILVKPNAGLGPTIPAGQSAILRCDGSKVVYAVSPSLENSLGVSVKDYGAQCNANAVSPTDDTQAIKNCLAQAPEGSTIYFPGPCLISDEITVTRKLNLRGTGSAIATLKKASGFPNKPALTVGNGTDGLSGVSVFDFMIDGNDQAGDGAKFQKLGSFTLMNFRSEDNKGWGMVRNGLWLSSMSNVVLLGNGTAASGGTATSGGGVVDSFSIRETSDLTCVNFNANFNHNHQMLWGDAVQNILQDGSEGVPYRMVGYYQLGGEYGTNQQSGLTNSVVAIRTADRSGFFGVKFNSATDTNVHDLEIGSPSTTSQQPLSDIDELSFDSCHTQKNHDSSDAFYGVKVNNRITSFSFTRQSHSGSEKFMDLSSVTSGDVFINDSETILFQSINDPNGIVNKDTISVTAFGVKADGTTDNKDTLQQAIDYAASVGKTLYYPSSGNFIKVTRPIYVRSNSNWVGGGEIRNTTVSTGINGVCLMPGGFHPSYFHSYNSDIVTYTQYPINAVNSGRTITTSTAAHASNFAVGDLLWVTTTKTWVGSAGDYPVTAHLSEVVSANDTTGVIVLDTPISEAMATLYGNLQVCNAQEAAVQDVRGNNMLLCKDAQINGISITSDHSAAMSRGGMYKCDFNFKDIRAREAIFANAFVNTSVRAQTVTTTRKLCDIAAYSNQFYINIDSAIYDGSLAESNLPAFSRVGECSRNGSITVQNMNCSGYIDPDPLVMIDTGCRNVSQTHPNVVAPNHGEETGTGSAFRLQQGVSSNRQIYIAATTWTGNTAFAIGDRILNGGNGYICKTSGTSAATGGPTGTTTGADIADGTVVWRYVTNVAAIGQTVLNYGDKFDSQGASRTGGLKVYLNNVLLPVGTGAGKYQINGANTTITLGTALLAEDRIKIGAAADYQLTLEDCWISVNAKLGGSAGRGASIADSAQNANPPTVRNIKRCGFKDLNIDAPSTAFPQTGQAVDIEGEYSYINNAQVSTGELFVSSFADHAIVQGFFADGAKDLSPNSTVRIISNSGFQAAAKTYDSVSDMVADTSRFAEVIAVRGYYEPGAGAAVYTVMTLAAYGKTPDQKGAAFTLADNKVAVLKHDGAVSDLQFGVKRDGSTDNGANLVALLAAAKDQKFEVLFTDGIAVTNTALTIDKALFSIRGSGKLMSYLNIGSTFPEGSALLTVNDCGRTNGTGANEKPFYTGIEKSVEMVGFTLMGNGRVRRAHGLAFTGLNDDMLVDVECRDFKGVGLSLGNADVVKVNAGSFVGGTTYKIAFLGTDTAVDPDEQEANIQARWVAYTGVSKTYKIGTQFTNSSSNGAALTGAVVAVGYTSDTVRESTFENIQIKNCGNINTISGVAYDDPAMRIGSNGSNQGDNNIWFPLLRLIYSRGSALKIIPNVSNRARKIRIGHLFLHANKQLPNPGTDPNGENFHSGKDLIIVGNQGAVEGSSEIASVSVDQVDLVGLEVGNKCFVVNTGSSLHVGGFTGNASNGSYYFYFNGAETSSIRNYNRGGIRVGSPVKSTANLIKIDAMQTFHQVSVSGVAATTVPSGSKKFATLPSGQWVVGNFYVIRNLGTGGTASEINARWVTYLGQARPAGGNYQIGDTFTANSNSQTPLTGAVCGTSGFRVGVEYKILDLGTAGTAEEIQAKWVTYTGVSKTYSVGDIFTATANDSTLLTAAIVKVPYFPSYVGDIKHINDDNVIIANIYKPQDAGDTFNERRLVAFPRTALYTARGVTYIQKLYLVTNSALVANDTNYAQIQFIKVRADQTTCPLNSQTPPAEDCFAGQIARIETRATGAGSTGSWKIGQLIEITFTDPRLEAGEGLAFTINKVGAGVVVPHLGVVAELSPNLSLAGEVE